MSYASPQGKFAKRAGINDPRHDDPFADMSDDLGEVYGKGGRKAAPRTPTHREPCAKCSGTGAFRSYTGRTVGECFKCHGKGYLEFTTSPEAREKARKRSQDRKQADAEAKAQLGREWLEANPDHAKWISDASRRGFEFAGSMLNAVMTYGQPTAGQLAAIEKCMARDAERQKNRDAERKMQDVRSVGVANDAILVAMKHAREGGKKWVKLQYSGLVFKLGAAGGQNAEAIWVTRHDDGTFLGGVVDGVFRPRAECSEETKAKVLEILADPAKAAKVHGLQTGICSCCGRELTNAGSIAAGIGPICAERFGW